MTYSIIAERELVVAFSLVGVKGFIATSREEALLHFNSLTKGTPSDVQGVKILIISEQISEYLHDEVTQWQLKGSMEGKKSLQDSIREAVGVHI